MPWASGSHRAKALVVDFAAPNGRALVSLVGDALFVIYTPASAATFASSVDRLRVDNRTPAATFEIQIPRTALRIEIVVGRRSVFLREGGRITTAASEDRPGHWALSLAPTKP